VANPEQQPPAETQRQEKFRAMEAAAAVAAVPLPATRDHALCCHSNVHSSSPVAVVAVAVAVVVVAVAVLPDADCRHVPTLL